MEALTIKTETPAEARKRKRSKFEWKPAHIFIHAFCAWHLFALFVDGIPSDSALHTRLLSVVKPYIRWTAVWHNGWGLFAPVPDNSNAIVTALMRYEDGSEKTWSTPDWIELSIGEHFYQSRMMKYVDNLTADQNKVMWPALTAYLAREYAGASPLVDIEITRHRGRIPGPAYGDYQPFKRYQLEETTMLYRKTFP